VLNPGGFRRADECVRHKMLDAIGDLALAGAPILGAYRGVRAGHGATNRLLRRLWRPRARGSGSRSTRPPRSRFRASADRPRRPPPRRLIIGL
jgi:UDP-3-O-acyl-N-acetylglucosamine deacetylase